MSVQRASLDADWTLLAHGAITAVTICSVMHNSSPLQHVTDILTVVQSDSLSGGARRTLLCGMWQVKFMFQLWGT